MGLVHWKSRQTHGTGNKPNTRAQSAINSVTAKVKAHADRYRAARKALVALDPDAFKLASRTDPSEGKWVRVFHELSDLDIRNPRGDDLDEAPPQTLAERRRHQLGEGHREVPWIWTSVRPTGADYFDSNRVSDEEAVEGTRSLQFL